MELIMEHYGDEEPEDEVADPFRTLVGCVLSQRTKDVNGSRAAERLFEAIGCPQEVVDLPQDELKELIRCSGFYNQKARNIRSLCTTLLACFDGEVPDDRETLMSLPGVGPKTADIVLSHAFSMPTIAVDVHVARVAKRTGLVDADAGPKEVKKALEGMVPRAEYRLVDAAFVRHGKEYCRSRSPRCGECPLRRACSYYKGWPQTSRPLV